MRPEIVATLGPASDHEKIWAGLLSAGASAFRLNTSHLDLPELDGWLERLESFRRAARQDLPLVIDLQGSKWRLGSFDAVDLPAGQKVTLVLSAEAWQPGWLPVPHADFFAAAKHSSGEVVLNDAKARLRLESTAPERAEAVVIQAGPVAPRKGITYANSSYRVETLSEKDRAIVARVAALESVRVAVSYVRDADEMAAYRALLGGRYAIAKVERQPAVAGIESLARQCDEVWVCRGDLGAELGLPGMARAVAAITAQLAQISAPLLMAGQVFEHMTASPTPTRSEICYLYDVLSAGYRGTVLSDETAVGRYPVESVRAAALF